METARLSYQARLWLLPRVASLLDVLITSRFREELRQKLVVEQNTKTTG